MSIARQVDMARIDQQIAMVEYMQANSKSPSSPEEINEQQIAELKAEKGILKGEEAEESVYTKAAQAGRQALGRARQSGYNANRWLANIPTPGGIWVPFWVLFFLWMILIPINGHTRMMWFWLVLNGHARIPSLGSAGGPVSGTPFFGAAVLAAAGQQGSTSTPPNTQPPPNNTPGNKPKTGSTTPGVNTPPPGTGVDVGIGQIGGTPGSTLIGGNIINSAGLIGSDMLQGQGNSLFSLQQALANGNLGYFEFIGRE